MFETIKLLIQDVQDPLYRRIFEALLEELEATRRWEERFERLEALLEELIQAQRNFHLALEGVQREIEALKEAQKETQREIEALKEAVRETQREIEALKEAQKETQKEIEALKEAVRETQREIEALKEAQKETQKEIEALKEAQKETQKEIEALKEAQKETQKEIEALKEAQKETQKEIEALKEAQKETNRSIDGLREEFRKEKEDIWKILTKLTENLEKLNKDHRVTREQLGGLAHAVGYLLEDRAFVGLPRLLAEEGFEVEEPFRREYLQVGHERWIEVNIYGVIRRNGERFYVIGEAKTQLKKRDVDQFLRHLKEVERWLPGRRLFPLLVTYQTSPQVREYVRKKGLRLYFSFQFPLVSGPF